MARWTPDQNASRSAKLTGRQLSLEQRAAIHASARHGRDRTDAWQAAYQERLALLKLRERIIRELEAGATLDVPEEFSGNHQLSQIIRSATVRSVSVDRLIDELHTRTVNPETLVSLSAWLSNEPNRSDVALLEHEPVAV